MDSISSSTEQAYYKLQRKEKELRQRIETEKESNIKSAELPSYLVAKYETSINLQKKKLLSVESEYERKKTSYLQQIAFFQNLLDTLETSFPRQREEVEIKLKAAEDVYDKEKEKYSQEKKTKVQIKAEKELEEVLRQKEMLIPTKMIQEALKPSPLTPPAKKPEPAPKPAPVPESDSDSDVEEEKKEEESRPVRNLGHLLLEAEERRQLDRVAREVQAANARKEQQRREEEARRQDAAARLAADREHEERLRDEIRKKNWAEAEANGGRLPVLPSKHVEPDSDEEQEDDKDSVAEMTEEEFQAEIKRRKEEQRKKFHFIKPEPVQPAPELPVIVGNTKQKKQLKRVSFPQ